MSVKGVHASYQFAIKNDINKKVHTMSNTQNQNSKKVVVSSSEHDNQKMVTKL